jgi:hypothetical protein
VSDISIQTIRVPLLLWMRAIPELRKRGQGQRESGAFLLGTQHGPIGKVMKFVCYDDLDPHAYQGGGIQFHDTGYSVLWKLCRERSLQILCDVHTHPSSNVGQSPIDQQHPMIAVVGHTAMIIPHYAHTSRWSLSQVGVYEYLGGHQWRIHGVQPSLRRVRLALR